MIRPLHAIVNFISAAALFKPATALS